MLKVKITVMKIVQHDDLMMHYENPIEHACSVKQGDVFISENALKPDNFCQSAWDSMREFVLTLACGGSNFFNGWMKNPKSAMISCNDGFRPVSFLLEALDDIVSK